MSNELVRTLNLALNQPVQDALNDAAKAAPKFSADQIRAIFNSVAYSKIVLPELPKDPKEVTAEMIEAREALIAQNSADLLLIAHAEEADAAAAAAVKERALKLIQTAGATLAAAGLVTLRQTLATAANAPK